MNGIRYDSFYVSTCGVIALSNRRYLYDGEGKRSVPPNKTDCYDPMSADWPFYDASNNLIAGRPHQSPLSGESVNDATPDNYGFRYIACGGSYADPAGGIRTPLRNGDGMGPMGNPPTAQPSILRRIQAVPGAAFITPMEGPFYLPQIDPLTGRSDNYGQVLYKRSNLSDKLFIYYKNMQLDTGYYRLETASGNIGLYGTVTEGRPQRDMNCVSGSVQVELNRLDSSITFRYGEWKGNSAFYNITGGGQSVNNAHQTMRPFLSMAVGGWARHKSYVTNDPGTHNLTNEATPWGGQYVQYTQQFNGFVGKSNTDPFAFGVPDMRLKETSTGANMQAYKIKFKQWKNSLRMVDIQYFVRAKSATATNFTEPVVTTVVQDTYDPFELFAGHAQLGQLQPVALIQNLTNDIQGPSGVNFVEQDFQFQARLLIRNRVTDKYVYNRSAKISDNCLDYVYDENNLDCGSDPYAMVRLVNVTKDMAGNYIAAVRNDVVTNKTASGVPPYNFVQVRFTPFVPNEYIPNETGLLELTAATEPINPNTNALIGDDWPFDDTNKINFWVITRISNFRYNGEFDQVTGIGQIPNITKAEVGKFVYSNFGQSPSVDIVPNNQAQSSYNPLPPISDATPILQMKWANVNNKSVGSKVTSWPIDMRNKKGSVMTLAVQRGLANLPVARGFSDRTLVGPEPRVVFMSGYDTTDRLTGKIDRITGNDPTHSADFDYLAVEYLRPSTDGIRMLAMTGGADGIDNIKQNDFNKTGGASGTTGESPNRTWRFHPVWRNGAMASPADSTINAPALAIYGGGGYFLGWTFANNQWYYPANWNGGTPGDNDLHGGSGLVIYNPTNATTPYTRTYMNNDGRKRVVAGLMYNPYDVGFDYEFYRYSVAIPDYFIEGSAIDQGRNFRFRVRMVETNYDFGTGDKQDINGPMPPRNPGDDEDAFLVDNIAIMFPDATATDLEAQVVKIIWPYRSVPASQASDLTLITRVANMGTIDAPPFAVMVKVYKGNSADESRVVYCKTQSVSQLLKGTATELTMPSFSAREFATSNVGRNVFTLRAIIIYPGNAGDLYHLNDTVTSTFDLTFSDEITYASEGAGNDVDGGDFGVGITGKGLNLFGNKFSGFLTAASFGNPPKPQMSNTILTKPVSDPMGYTNYYSVDGLPWLEYICGGSLDDERFGYPRQGSISGEIAMKFELSSADRVNGVYAQFAAANQAFDDISFNLYHDADGKPGTAVTSQYLPLYAHRLMSKTAIGTETIRPVGQKTRYDFAQPIDLQAGTYWLAIAQRGETGLELAASAESMGMRTMLVHTQNSDQVGGVLNGVTVGVMGGNGIQLMVDKRFRTPTTVAPYGRVYVNNNVFAYKNVLGSSSDWNRFMPTSGHIAYAHLDHLGTLNGYNANRFKTFTRGTWLPLISPYFGEREIEADNNYYPCDPEEITNVGIEVTTFSGYARNGGIDLTWETASEINNHSFIIERATVNEDIWTEVSNVVGAGNSTATNIYRLRDENVTSSNVYKYRLYNMDFDGTISCQNNNIITVEYNDFRTIELSQNSPNPFNSETHITVTIPESQTVTLEVLDIFGKVVKTLVDNEILKGKMEYTWNGLDNNNMKVADGNYIYKLTAGNEILTKKMSFIKSK